jgi:nicotinamide-nucleotide amidase
MTTRSARELKTLLLAAPCLTVAVAESLTAGRVQAGLGAIAGASEFFLGGITAYTLDQKVRHLSVDRREAAKVNSVSGEVARQMARGAAKLFGSDLAVATTGYAERAPEQGVRAPQAYWALVHCRRGRVVAECGGLVVCAGLRRIEVQTAVTDVVLAELLAYVRTWRG